MRYYINNIQIRLHRLLMMNEAGELARIKWTTSHNHRINLSQSNYFKYLGTLSNETPLPRGISLDYINTCILLLMVNTCVYDAM